MLAVPLTSVTRRWNSFVGARRANIRGTRVFGLMITVMSRFAGSDRCRHMEKRCEVAVSNINWRHSTLAPLRFGTEQTKYLQCSALGSRGLTQAGREEYKSEEHLGLTGKKTWIGMLVSNCQ